MVSNGKFVSVENRISTETNLYLEVYGMWNYNRHLLTRLEESSSTFFNVFAVDYDPGASEVNQLNRIKLMLSTAQKNLEKEEYVDPNLAKT